LKVRERIFINNHYGEPQLKAIHKQSLEIATASGGRARGQMPLKKLRGHCPPLKLVTCWFLDLYRKFDW